MYGPYTAAAGVAGRERRGDNGAVITSPLCHSSQHRTRRAGRRDPTYCSPTPLITALHSVISHLCTRVQAVSHCVHHRSLVGASHQWSIGHRSSHAGQADDTGSGDAQRSDTGLLCAVGPGPQRCALCLTTMSRCVSVPVPLRVQVCVRSFASAAGDAPLLKTALYDEHVKLGGKMASAQPHHVERRADRWLTR